MVGKDAALVLIDFGREYLEKNDLVGFYKRANQVADAQGIDGGVIGSITKFFEQNCGIDTVSQLKNEIPDFFACEVEYVPDGVATQGRTGASQGIAFPDNINIIGCNAFASNNSYDEVSLRGIKIVRSAAFADSSVEHVWLPEIDKINFEDNVFTGAYALSYVHVPYDPTMSLSDIEQWVYDDMLYGCSDIEVTIKTYDPKIFA